MEQLFEKYGISPALSNDQKLAALEKEKLKVLRKLNHVFGNPEKEAVLNGELEALERAMAGLEETGGRLSLDDIVLESRGLTQTRVEAGQTDDLSVREMERMIKAEGTDPDEVVELLYDVIVAHLKARSFEEYEYWLLYGARMGIGFCMNLLSDFYAKELYPKEGSPEENEKRALHWLKKGVEAGDKDCLEKMGLYYADPETERYDPERAAVYFVKAADADHPNSYIFAFQLFHRQGDYQKAETCLRAADAMEVQSAAHWFAVLYTNGENSEGKVDRRLAQQWLEKEYRRYPNGAVCFDLGQACLDNGDRERGLEVLRRGAEEFNSEVCREALNGQ